MTVMGLSYHQPIEVNYGQEIEAELERLSQLIAQTPALTGTYRPRWLAIQLLEGDQLLVDEVAAAEGGQAVVEALNGSLARLQRRYGDEVEILLADYRYDFVRGLVNSVLTRPAAKQLTLSDRVDRIVTNRYLGIPLFLTLMYLVFNVVQNVSAPFLDWIEAVISGPVSGWALGLLSLVGAPAWLMSLVVEGIIAGVGGVLVFVPGLVVLFFSLALLEDSGYMARAAYVMDRFMSLFGLHGKSFVPLVIGFGCNVPAIYATRTIESRPARILTGMMIPFMSCSARLPVYVIFALAFFPRQAGWVIWGMYLLGIGVATVVGLTLSRLLFKGQQSALVMELPAYKLPTWRNLFRHTWHRTSHFIKKAGTIILMISVVVWFLLNLPFGVETPRESLYGQLSATVAPVFNPAGFGSWEAAGSLVTGFIAKEMVVSTMAEVYGTTGESAAEITAVPGLVEGVSEIVVSFGQAVVDAGKQLLEVLTPGLALFPAEAEPVDTALSRALTLAFTPLSAIAFLVFVLLYVPCVATLSAQAHEFGWRWAGLGVGVQLLVPWLLAVLIYQGGLLLGLGG